MRLARADSVRITQVEDLLASMRLDGAEDHLRQAVIALRELSGASRACLYVLAPAERGLRVDSIYSSAMAPRFRDTFDRFLADKVVGWTGFNPLCPEPWQRNVALDEHDIRPRVGDVTSEREFYPSVGMRGFGTTRVLLCDGPQLLAYLGLFDAAPSVQRTKHVLRRLEFAFRRRMRMEHLLRSDSPLASALETALAQLGTAALLVDRRGHVLAANELGRRKLESDAAGARCELLEGVRRGSDTTRFRMVPIRMTGGPDAYLALARAPAHPNGMRLADAAVRFGFTHRQCEIARLVAEGHSNRGIAVRMGIAERTVEAHMTAMFEKTGAESRAALVARLLH